ncbi:hypothetical protein SEA_EASTWEST_46 [Arthrobacter phage EastWest]|uniref:Uncharacterized protein n=1 Tax=Arthrobacter phage EastWest TaxID=2894292 RepID=A0AAE9C9J6_9CAUD|nr:hypothetical protein SEA_EASTWEST_46 [Arthrobacter phage EastWest]
MTAPENFVELYGRVERMIDEVVDGARPLDVAGRVIVAVSEAINTRTDSAEQEILKLKRALAAHKFDGEVFSMREEVRTEMIRLSADLYDQTLEQKRMIETLNKIIDGIHQGRRDAENVLLGLMTHIARPEFTVTFEAIRRMQADAGISIERDDPRMQITAKVSTS